MVVYPLFYLHPLFLRVALDQTNNQAKILKGLIMRADIVNQKLEKVLNRIEKIDDAKLKPWLNLHDACNYTTLSRIKIRRACMAGELKVSRATGKLLFRKEWLDRWLNG